LLFESHFYPTGLVVASFVSMIVTDFLECVANNLLVVYGCLCGDFTEHHDHVGLGTGLTCNSGVGVLGLAGIKDCIRDLIAELVRVTLIHRLRRKEESALSPGPLLRWLGHVAKL